MRKNFSALLTITLLCCAPACLCAQDSQQWCDKVNVRVEPSQLPVRIHELRFESLGVQSSAALRLDNQERKAIRDYLILIEFFDKETNYLLTIPFFTESAATGETPFPITFNRWLYRHSNSTVSPLEPSTEKVLFGDSPTVALACPAAARIVWAGFRYVDGTSVSYGSNKFTLDPIIAWAPISSPSLSQLLPIVVRAKLAVDGKGNATLIDLDSKSKDLFDILSQQIAGWMFSPPLANGETSSADVTLLLCIEDVGHDGPLSVGPPPEFPQQVSLLRISGVRALIAVHAFRATPRAKRWIVMAGWHWVEKLDERQR